jgi:protein-glucosylgalactosylhydroxylysine glucosidase
LNDYHPQFDNYEIGQTIKQADAILIGYPLQFKSKSTSRLNDLRFYKNVIRPDGPAMSFSMLAINYFEVNELVIAQEMLIKSYKPYISKPFYIWNEVAEGEVGATNFVVRVL